MMRHKPFNEIRNALAAWLRLGPEFQVFKSVVLPITVFVMHVFTLDQSPAHVTFHHNPVLRLIPSADHFEYVTLGIELGMTLGDARVTFRPDTGSRTRGQGHIVKSPIITADHVVASAEAAGLGLVGAEQAVCQEFSKGEFQPLHFKFTTSRTGRRSRARNFEEVPPCIISGHANGPRLEVRRGPG